MKICERLRGSFSTFYVSKQIKEFLPPTKMQSIKLRRPGQPSKQTKIQCRDRSHGLKFGKSALSSLYFQIWLALNLQ